MAAMVDILRDDRFAPTSFPARSHDARTESDAGRAAAERGILPGRCFAAAPRPSSTPAARGRSGGWATRPTTKIPGRDRRPRRLPGLSLAGPPLRPLRNKWISAATGTGTRRWAWPCCGRRCASRSAIAANTTAGSRSCSTRTPSTTAARPAPGDAGRGARGRSHQIHTAQYAHEVTLIRERYGDARRSPA